MGFGALVVDNLMKPNELAAPAKEKVIKTCGFASLVIKRLLKGLSLYAAACDS